MASDFSIPFKAKPIGQDQKELPIELECCRLAEADGWEQRKLGDDAWPDRMFLKDGQAVFVEFKRPKDARIATRQKNRVQRLRRLRFLAIFCDSVIEVRRTVLGHAI